MVDIVADDGVEALTWEVQLVGIAADKGALII